MKHSSHTFYFNYSCYLKLKCKRKNVLMKINFFVSSIYLALCRAKQEWVMIISGWMKRELAKKRGKLDWTYIYTNVWMFVHTIVSKVLNGILWKRKTNLIWSRIQEFLFSIDINIKTIVHNIWKNRTLTFLRHIVRKEGVETMTSIGYIVGKGDRGK